MKSEARRPRRADADAASRHRESRPCASDACARTPAALEITAFINLIVVLVPFLLSTAVFTRLAVIDLTLPAQSNDALRAAQGQRPQARGRDPPRRDRSRRPHRRPDPAHPEDATGHYDVKALDTLTVSRSSRSFPTTPRPPCCAEPNTPYDTLVHVMDAVRAGQPAATAAPRSCDVELFPDISIGDAPIRHSK